MFVFGAVISEALFTIFGKAASERMTPLASGLSYRLVARPILRARPLPGLGLGLYQAVGFSGWVAVLHYGMFVMTLGYLLWFGGLSRVLASTAGVFTGCCR